MQPLKESILLERHNSKILFIVTGCVFLLNGLFNILNNHIKPFGLVFGIVMLILSGFYIVYAFLGFSSNSSYSAKICITEKFIELKSSFWKSAVFIYWSDIVSIYLVNRKVGFELKNGEKLFSNKTKSDQFKQLNRLLKEVAEPKNINIISE